MQLCILTIKVQNLSLMKYYAGEWEECWHPTPHSPALLRLFFTILHYSPALLRLLFTCLHYYAGEWEEWGNPNERKYFEYMLQYRCV